MATVGQEPRQAGACVMIGPKQGSMERSLISEPTSILDPRYTALQAPLPAVSVWSVGRSSSSDSQTELLHRLVNRVKATGRGP